MSVDNQKSMSGDAAQSKLDAIRARFQAQSAASVDAALQAVTGGDQAPVNPDQNVSKDIVPSVDTSKQRTSRRKAGADRAGRAKRTGKGAAAPLLKAAESQATQTEDPLLDKLTDLLSSPDSGTPATPEPTVAATTGMDAMPDEDRMAAEWAAALAENTRPENLQGELFEVGMRQMYQDEKGAHHMLERERGGYVLYDAPGEKPKYYVSMSTDEARQVIQNRKMKPVGSPQLMVGSKERKKKTWTEEELWAGIPDGREFALVSFDRKKRFKYRRKGNEFFLVTSGDGTTPVPTETILKFLNDAKEPRDIDLIEPPSETFRLPKLGQIVYYQSEQHKGKEIIVRCTAPDLYVFSERVWSNNPTSYSDPISQKEMLDILTAEGWEVVGEVDEPLSTKELPVLRDELFILPEIGEEFFFRDKDGVEFKVAQTAAGFILIAIATGKSRSVNKTELQVLAQKNQWQRFEASPSVKIESPKPDELALGSPEASKPELVGPPILNEALAKVEETVAQTRKQLVEVEFEQKKQEGVLKGIRRVLGTLVGKDIDLGPQVTERRVEYQANLAQLLNLRIESLKRQKLEGKKLREEIAGLSREFEFEEGERLDDARYQIRLGEDAVTLKEKWHKVLEGAKRGENIYTPKDGYSEVTGQKEWYNKWALVWGSAKYAGEVVGRGVRVTGETYNKITKTRTGKMVTMAAGAAGAATLAFASGGAALGLAGVAMAAKRAAAGAGVALAAEEGMGMVARGYRSREATKNTESMLERLEARGVIGTDEGWDELLHTLSQRSIDGLVDRDLARRKWALRRKAIAMFGGTLMGTGAAAQLIGIGVQEAREAVSGSGAVERVAARLGDAASAPSGAASAPSPAAVASAAEASASAPSGSASAAAGAASASPLVESGKVEGTLRTSYSRGIDEVLDRAGRAEAVGRAFAEARTIASGDTIWKYGVEAAKTAGLDEAGQKRFSVALTQALREKLSMMSPEEAAKYGFYPNKDGLLTPDYIRANDKLDLVGLLGQEKLAALVEQAETGGASGGVTGAVVEERATGVSSDGRVANMKDSIAWSKPDYGPGEAASAVAEEATSTVKAVVEAVDTRASLMTEFQSFKKGDILNYVQRLPREEQAEIFRTMRRTVGDLFNTPETSIYADSPQAQYLFTDHPEFAKVSMSRVLEDHQTLSSKAFYMYDRTTNPLHWTQMQEMAKFAEAAEKTLDKKLAVPFRQESIDEYVLRMAAIARATGKTIPGLRMVN